MSAASPIEILQMECPRPESDPRYDDAETRTITLPKGYKKQPEYAAFKTDTIFEKDIKIPLRDGTIIRADIFRPVGATQKLPILMAWSPYGKSGRGKKCLQSFFLRNPPAEFNHDDQACSPSSMYPVERESRDRSFLIMRSLRRSTLRNGLHEGMLSRTLTLEVPMTQRVTSCKSSRNGFYERS